MGSPSTGVKSTLKSPVCTTVPTGVWMASAQAPAMEWLTLMNSISKRAELYEVARLDHVHLHALDVAVLLELLRHQRQRQPRAVHGRGQLLEHIGRGADVVLVAVGDDVAADAVAVLGKVGKVGDHQVDARHIVAGKHGAHVHHHDVVPVFKHGHVHADLAQSPQGDDAQPRLLLFRFFLIFLCQKDPSFASKMTT